MSRLQSKLFEYYERLIHNISFLPSIITLIISLIAFIMFALETKQTGSGIDLMEYMKVQSPENARSILSGILTGMIALTVFSFSMMMVVVNQASSNYSPKVVDTFINDRSNQYILGVYLGTIVFALITMMQIDSPKVTGGVPNSSLLLIVLLTIYSILLFVKFITNISNSVRIGAITERIYLQTKASLSKEENFNYCKEEFNSEKWTYYPAEKSGYFQKIQISRLTAILKKEDLVLKVIPLPGQYFTQLTPLFCLNKEVKDQKILDSIRNTFLSYIGEDIKENPFYGFRQLREIAVKGLSPGINDPGVARVCIDYLGSLLSILINKERNTVISDSNGKGRIILNKYDFAAIFGICFTSIKAYSKKDYTVLNALLISIKDLCLYDPGKNEKKTLEAMAKAVVEEANTSIYNSLEREFLNDTIEALNNTGYCSLDLLKINFPENAAEGSAGRKI